MGLMDEIISEDALAFADPDLMPGSESMTYTKVGGATRTVYGNVVRDPPIELPGGPNGTFFPKMTISFPNNTTNGITPTEIDNGGDTITVAYPIGASAAAHPIIGTPIEQDAGMILIAVGMRS